MDAQPPDIVTTFGKHLLDRPATPVPPLILTHGFPFFSRVCEALENLQELYPYQRIWRSKKYGDEIADDTLPGFTPPSVRYRYELEMEDLERQRAIETPPDSCWDDSNNGKTIAANMPPTPVSSNPTQPSDFTPMASRKSSSPLPQVGITIKTGHADKARPEDTNQLEDTMRPEDETGRVDFSSNYHTRMSNEDVPGDIARRTSALTEHTAANGCSSRGSKRKLSVDDPREEEHSCFAGNEDTGSRNALEWQISATGCATRGLKRQLSEDERSGEQQSHSGVNGITGEYNAPILNQRLKRRKKQLKGDKRAPATV